MFSIMARLSISATFLERVQMSWDPVYQLVQQIPRGRVLTYGALAKALRLPGGARTAGRAMASTPSGQGIPWHRVVGERGKILIRGPHAMLQKKLLESEGVKLIESRVQLSLACLETAGKNLRSRKAELPQKRAKRPHATSQVLDRSIHLAQGASTLLRILSLARSRPCRIPHLCYNSFR